MKPVPNPRKPLAAFLACCGALFAFAFPLVAAALADENVDEANELGKYLAQHGYGAMAVDREDNNREMVEAKINGEEVNLAIDTGCGKTCLSASCARHLKLDVHDTHHVMLGAGGVVKGNEGVALITSFTLNNYEINRTSTIDVLSKSAYTRGIEDGLLGFDYLRLNDVILPVGAKRFLYKPGNGPAADLGRYMNALGFKGIPLQFAKGGLRIEGTLNGQPFTALIDCGAALSTFDLTYLRKTSPGAIYPSRINMEGVDGIRGETYVFSPKRLTLGSLSVDPPEMTACQTATFSKLGFDALLGYDFLASHQAILDLGHDTLWMK